jgi:uridine phosphorylase
VVPTAALIDEGTSAHYDAPRLPPALSHPTPAAVDEIRRLLRSHQGRLHAGRVWTTDAIFRETPRKIKGFRDKGALAVDMETSAIFSVARFRGADIAVILVVSDELFSLKWVPGFKTEAFAAGRALASEVIERLCRPRSTRSSSEEPQS